MTLQKKEYLELKKWFDEEGKKVLWEMMSNWRGIIDKPLDAFYIFARAFYDDKLLNEKLGNNKSIKILFYRIDNEYHDFVEEVREKLSPNQIKSIILNFYNLDNIRSIHMIPGFSIPTGISELSYKLLDIKKGDKLFQPNSQAGEFMIDFLINHPECDISAIEINTSYILTSQLKLPIIGHQNRASIRQEDYFNTDLSTLEYNKVFSMPPMGMLYRDFDKRVNDKNLIELYKKNDFNTKNEWTDILKIISNTKFEKAIFIVHSGILFKERDEKIRKYLIDNGYIESVIELAPRLFTGIGISTNILLISKNNKKVKMVDASEIYHSDKMVNKITKDDVEVIFDAYKNESTISKEVSPEEFEDNNYSFIPRRYTNEEIDLKNYVYLKDITKIKRGYANLKKSDLYKRISRENTNNKIIAAGDIDDNFNIADLTSLTEIEDKEETYCVKDGDIIFSRGGSYNSLLIRNSGNYRILVNGTLYILNCDEQKIDPYYLQMYLASDHCLSQIESLNTGKSIQFMSINQLGELKIPKVSKEKEKELSQKYKMILDKKEIIRIQKIKLEEDVSELVSEVI
ncbi:putative type I restriction-modification system methylation subunit [Finegoldia magna ATCC 29328]|uniref:site-specific DNA-methyltransferase (adenine-specific) n=1 Tax=Finegoldia magna (strain ATCC 29328 / DSM 20472 / WAL 2508) TaxID=334413 RepID=B0RZN3_FINM2|nr:putative type I restriction-modification system methylation subunit [Finegoldia magna ATCC 29328]